MYFYQDSHALRFRDGHELIEIRPWGTNAFRVRSTLNADFSSAEKALLVPGCVSSPEIKITDNGASIINGAIRCTVTPMGCLRFDKEDTLVLAEYHRGRDANLHSRPIKMEARQYRTTGNDYEIFARFESDPNEKLFGMGQYQQPELNLKGCVLELNQRNSQISIPFCLSSEGYGFLWNHPGTGDVSFGKNFTRWHAEEADELDYWVTVGDTPKQIVENYTAVTGRAPKFPENALGLWQCKLRYRTQEELLEVAREYKRRGIPLDVIVIDFFHWCNQGDWCFDPVYWPDPKAMVDELKSMGIRCMVSIWPTADCESMNWNALQQRGLLVRAIDGTQQQISWGGQNVVFVDATNPEAREFVWEKAKANYYDHGIDLFWLDCNEPEFSAADAQGYHYYVGPQKKCAGLYPKLHVKTFWDGLRSEGRDDIISLSRSAWVGAQQYGTLVWSGDVQSDFVALKDQVSAGLNIGIAGIPWWNSDTGGFQGSDVNDPMFTQLLIRWFQFSTFTPVLRLHGNRGPENIPPLSDKGGGKVSTGQPNEIWSYGKEAEQIMLKYLDIRLKMKDYLVSVMDEASANGSPVIRTMFYEFPDDPRCWELDEQYMLGSRYLVAPILYPDTWQREVYLPTGLWRNIHDGNTYQGGKAITADAPIDIIPVYERIG